MKMDDRLFKEIEHGKKIASDAGHVWNWESPAGKLRWERRVKMLTGHIRPGMEVLELGCGTGYYTKELKKTGARITAIDISEALLKIAKDSVCSDRVLFKIENAYDMSFEDGKFDAVVGISVLHHLDLAMALKDIYRVLKVGGTVRFSEPNMMNPQIALQKNIPFIKEKMGDSPDETAFFRWVISRRLIKYGFKDVTVEPFDFLHPSLPERVIPFLNRLGLLAEKIPVIREISGSLYISAKK